MDAASDMHGQSKIRTFPYFFGHATKVKMEIPAIGDSLFEYMGQETSKK